MPRQARKKSENNIYHIMFRGINRQIIFEEAEDNDRFLEILTECKAISGYKVLAYCLMGNHIHLLMQFNEEPIEQSIKRITTRFVYWYNAKYGRVGHLFQDRFKSEPIDDDKHLLSCIRYIHQNPVKSDKGKIDKYPYSSYSSYLNQVTDRLVDIDFLYDMITLSDFIEFCNIDEKSSFIDIDETVKKRVTDECAKQIIFKVSKCSNATEFQQLEITQKKRILNKLKQKGLGIRQISRLTGETYYLIQKA